MTAIELNNIRKAVQSKTSLIHAITNPISINQCANTILAVGARPIMAEHPSEVKEITETADALMLNMGNITDVRMESMQISLNTAKSEQIPVLLDAVGVACSDLRRKFVNKLINTKSPTVIKGNYSEINALYNQNYVCSGVDAENLDQSRVAVAAAELAQRHKTIILASGKVDIVTDGSRLVSVKNGSIQLGKITGTGCMLGALCSAYLSVTPDISAVVCACAVLGICGELSQTDKGNGTFSVNLMDNLSTLSDEKLKKYLKTEMCKFETY